MHDVRTSSPLHLENLIEMPRIKNTLSKGANFARRPSHALANLCTARPFHAFLVEAEFMCTRGLILRSPLYHEFNKQIYFGTDF